MPVRTTSADNGPHFPASGAQFEAGGRNWSGRWSEVEEKVGKGCNRMTVLRVQPLDNRTYG